MKTILKLTIIIFIVALFGCNDSFLDRVPRDRITAENFFSNENDLETFCYSFYESIPLLTNDNVSDNVTKFSEITYATVMVGGAMSAETIDDDVWEWEHIRNANYFLQQAGNAAGEPTSLNHWVGFGRLMRAYLYYDKVKSFGDVPWFDKPLLDTDTEQLFKAKDSRDFVVGKIMEDLEFASANMLVQSDKSFVDKYAALALQARIALHEGSFRKYHNISDADKYFEIAETASNAIITASAFELHSNYTQLFNSISLSGNKEVILAREHILGMTEFVLHTVQDLTWGISRDLVDSYLMTDGTSFASQPGAATMDFDAQFVNRDSRLRQTAHNPGWIDPKRGDPYILKTTFGGYAQVKFYPSTAEQCYYYTCESDVAQIRYAEVLLIYAEAKAELGTLTNDDLDITVNKLRKRGGITKVLTIADANSSPDPVEIARYHNLDGTNKGIISEIRRERRVELACEGFRYDDLMRWKCGNLVVKSGEGIYVPQFGPMDVTGDGVDDIAILANKNETSPISHLTEAEQDALVIYFLDEANLYLSNGASGNISFNQDRNNPKTWKDMYYYLPIPQEQIRLSEGTLEQTKDW